MGEEKQEAKGKRTGLRIKKDGWQDFSGRYVG